MSPELKLLYALMLVGSSRSLYSFIMCSKTLTGVSLIFTIAPGRNIEIFLAECGSPQESFIDLGLNSP